MLKLTKKADYGLIAMRHLAEHRQGALSAKDLAEAYGIPQEALAKILQKLAKAGLLVSQHGTHGGYTLARDARTISAFAVIEAIDGPTFIASCFATDNDCVHTTRCTVREPLRRVGESIQEVLTRLTISDLARPKDEHAGCCESEQPVASELVRLT